MRCSSVTIQLAYETVLTSSRTRTPRAFKSSGNQQAIYSRVFSTRLQLHTFLLEIELAKSRPRSGKLVIILTSSRVLDSSGSSRKCPFSKQLINLATCSSYAHHRKMFMNTPLPCKPLLWRIICIVFIYD